MVALCIQPLFRPENLAAERFQYLGDELGRRRLGERGLDEGKNETGK